MTYNPRITNQQSGVVAVSGNIVVEGGGLITASNLTCDSVTSSNAVGGNLKISSYDYERTVPIKAGVIKTSTNLTLTSQHHTILVEPSSANVTITLPTAADHVGRNYVIKKNISSSFNVTVTASLAANDIDTSSSVSLSSSYQTVRLISDGTGSWYII
jgi:hypothetical protein